MQNIGPVQVRCMKQNTQSWCSGTTQGVGVGGSGKGVQAGGDTYTLMTDSCQYMAKTTTIL